MNLYLTSDKFGRATLGGSTICSTSHEGCFRVASLNCVSSELIFVYFKSDMYKVDGDGLFFLLTNFFEESGDFEGFGDSRLEFIDPSDNRLVALSME